MIRYRRLYESENSDIKLYDVVRCAGYEWYVTDIEDDVVTLLAKNNDFGRCVFDYKSDDYKTSEIREYLKNGVLPKVQNANPIPTRLNDVGVTDKVWLLSTDNIFKLPNKIRKFDYFWWLRSRGVYVNSVAYMYVVGGGINVFAIGSDDTYEDNAVRPAMRVHVEDLD